MSATEGRHSDWPFVEGTKKRQWRENAALLLGFVAHCNGLGLQDEPACILAQEQLAILLAAGEPA